MIAVHKYFKGCHVEEQLELLYKFPRGDTKTNEWRRKKKTLGRQIFNSVKDKTF